MVYEGVLSKMQTEYSKPVQYFLVFENDFIHVNQLIGKTVKIEWIGEQCLSCGLEKEIFRQGFCSSCFFDKPLAGDWIMRPELSQAHLDIEDRDLEYEKKVQLQPHIVYLANSSNVKVGVTRKQQVPTRWIDQGAIEAIEIAELPNRFLAGICEIELKKYLEEGKFYKTTKNYCRKYFLNLNNSKNMFEYFNYALNQVKNEKKDYFQA